MSRTVGRVHVLRFECPPLPALQPFDVPGCSLRRRAEDGHEELWVERDDGVRMGQIRLHLSEHGDPFYGPWSRSDERFCYVSALEVTHEARGRGLSKTIMTEARRRCFDAGGRGLTSLVASSNEISIRTHAAIGARPVRELKGVRLGPRVVWWSSRPVDGARDAAEGPG